MGVLFLPSSDAYVRSLLYLLYTLIKLYYTKTLSNQALSLAPNWILLLQRPTIPVSFRSAITFHLGGSSGILKDKVRMLGALVLCSPSEHVFCCTLLFYSHFTQGVLVWMNEMPWAKQVKSPSLRFLLCGSVVPSYSLWQKPVRGLPANVKRHPASPLGTSQKWAKCVD